ncbi:PAS domain S-box protein [Methanospirillum hungatei]|uniref:PAS domain S-box protein n=1 Tax=Methanospirillum hungatei TaxID=2203 RepID=UPI0026E9DE92|nr:PAS domain S-box protein [Methanospirillum hungatei]MCA1917101.1 PAS domain S-box protein [Methanospirillum hungatei]
MQYLESVIQNALVWIMVLDKETNIVIWNKAAEEISGYMAEEVLGSKWIWESLYPDASYRKEITNEIIHIISEDSHFSNLKTRIHARNGSMHTITWNTRALRNENGDITGYVAVGIEDMCVKSK